MASVSSSNIYVHSSPPKAISGQGAAIRQWVKQGDLERLEQVILDGQGARLLGLLDTTAEPKVKAFLRSVPSYMAKVDLIHDAVIRGSLREVQALMEKRKLATGRDAVGRGALHKAVLYNHRNIVEYLGKKYPETLNIKDNEARTALHYCPAAKDPDAMYEILVNLGAKESSDIHGRKPGYYINNPENLDIEGPRSSNNRSKRARLDSTPVAKPISSTITRAQIRIWIHERDVGKLEKIVWSGNGDKLLLETTNNNKVKKFLLNVPHLLSRIKSIHSAAINNDVDTLKEIRSKSPDIPEVFTAKDSHGLTALHKAAGLAHRTIVEWYLYEFPSQLLDDQDNEGRTPLHYAAKDISTYNFLLKAGASEFILDMRGKTPSYYKKNVPELDGRHLRNIPDAPRVTGELTPWDRIVTSPGGIMDPKRRISNGEFNDEEQQPQAKKFNYDSDGYNGDTEGKYDIPEDVKIGNFDVETPAGDLNNINDDDGDDDDDFEPPIDEDEEEAAEVENNKKKQKKQSAVQKSAAKKSEKLVAQAEMEEVETLEEQQQEEETVEEIIEQEPEQERQTDPDPDQDQDQEQDQPAEEIELEEETAAEDADDKENEDMMVQEEQLLEEDEETNEETQTLEIDKDFGGISDEQLEDANLLDDSDEQADNPNENVIDTEDMEKLVEMVLDGNGKDLLNMKSGNPEVQEFISNIPAYMAKIASIHQAAASGNLRDLQTILDRKRLALAKDSIGLVPLHKAVLNGHSKVIRYLASNYNQSINAPDKSGRTPLHYAATLSDSGVTYKALIAAGADPNVKDSSGNTPGIYLRNKDLLTHADLVSQAMNNNNNSPLPEVLVKKAETWQRPPSEPVLELDDINIPVVDTPAKFVAQVRLRLSRNIQPFPFLPLMTKENLFEVERIVRLAEKSDSVMIRTNLEDLDKDKRKILEARNFWIPKAMKLSRFWPKARTFYTNEDLTKTIWVNGQDHVDIVVTSIYGKLKPILLNLHEIYIKLADSMQFHFNSNLGFLTVDPFCCGSGLKVNFTIRLPSLMKERSELASKCEELDLYINWKGSSDYIELENKISLINEIELLTKMANSINTLIDLENKKSRELFLLEQQQKKLLK